MMPTQSKKRLLITGVSGLLGNSLALHFRNIYTVYGQYNYHPVQIDGVVTLPADLTDADQVATLLEDLQPNIVIHCASLANVDECESRPQAAIEINTTATGRVATVTRKQGAQLVYISTDSVYADSLNSHRENKRLNPQNVYGQTKYDGEQQALINTDCLVLRTNFFGYNIRDKHSLAEWIIARLSSKEMIHGFTDAFFSTIYTMELARVIEIALQRKLSGIFNCGSPTPCSKFEFAQKLARRFGYPEKLILPGSIDDHSLKAKRAKNLGMDVSRLEKALNYPMPDLEFSIESFFRDSVSKTRRPMRRAPSGAGAREFIPYGCQSINSRDIAAVTTVLTSPWITQGPAITAFEKKLAHRCGARYAVAVNSGTAGLHIACLAAGIEPGDEVITSPNTFVASANCVVYCGGRPIFADIDARSYNISPDTIAGKLSARTRAIIPVHFAGQSCDMEAIAKLSRSAYSRFGKKLRIIEDGCHALGSEHRGAPVGACTYSDMTVMSFHPVKHITTGEGGAVLTNDEELYHRLIRMRSHGITSDPEALQRNECAFESATTDGRPMQRTWYYEQQELGFNYRITDIQCALGISQLERLDHFRQKRRGIVRAYNEAFGSSSVIQVPYESGHCNSNFHLYVLQFDYNKIGLSRPEFMEQLQQHGIQTQVHYIPVHTQPYYQQNFGYRWGDFPIAEAYYQQCLSIPSLSSNEQG